VGAGGGEGTVRAAVDHKVDDAVDICRGRKRRGALHHHHDVRSFVITWCEDVERVEQDRFG
jgi:hypothetical protein